MQEPSDSRIAKYKISLFVVVVVVAVVVVVVIVVVFNVLLSRDCRITR